MQNTKLKEFLHWLQSTVIVCIVLVVVLTTVALPTVVSGASMKPTYEDGDVVLVNIIGKKLSGVERFDVVVFKAPNNDTYVKRVIGLPGDDIAYENDVLYINGEAYEEAYLDSNRKKRLNNIPLTEDFTLQSVTDYTTVPEGYLFVLGDNRRNSLDSRSPIVGLVPIEDVLGATNIRLYPFGDMGLVE